MYINNIFLISPISDKHYHKKDLSLNKKEKAVSTSFEEILKQEINKAKIKN